MSKPLISGTLAASSGSSSCTSPSDTLAFSLEWRRLTCSSALISARPSFAIKPATRTRRAPPVAATRALARARHCTLPPGTRSTCSGSMCERRSGSPSMSCSRSRAGAASSSDVPTTRLDGRPRAERPSCRAPGAVSL
eukprot:2222494-Prymnesium_polylepis.1